MAIGDPRLLSQNRLGKMSKTEKDRSVRVTEQFLRDHYGMSYPAARTKSLLHVLRGYDTVCESAVSEIISSPNNILAVEYEKALLDTKITGFPIKRIGSGYHDTDHMKSFPSATAIRNLLSSPGAAHHVVELYQTVEVCTWLWILDVRLADL